MEEERNTRWRAKIKEYKKKDTKLSTKKVRQK
jgi:hypothetical protein